MRSGRNQKYEPTHETRSMSPHMKTDGEITGRKKVRKRREEEEMI